MTISAAWCTRCRTAGPPTRDDRRGRDGARPRGAADPVSALCALLAPGAPLAAACRYCYELRLHRARGYGALKAILEVLADQSR